MKAGVEVFSEKGYDAATMTEIAARSGTAIASLYRFFPSKESLADALLMEYAQQALTELDELRKKLAGGNPEAVADSLVGFRVKMMASSQRQFAVGLADARRGASDSNRKKFRKAMTGAVSTIIQAAIPIQPPARAHAMAAVVLHILKAVDDAENEAGAARQMFLREVKQSIRVYLAAAQG